MSILTTLNKSKQVVDFIINNSSRNFTHTVIFLGYQKNNLVNSILNGVENTQVDEFGIQKPINGFLCDAFDPS